ncbi:MAG TPA: CSLREA domain-containing protein [Candidatus Angelobacter sp.]
MISKRLPHIKSLAIFTAILGLAVFTAMGAAQLPAGAGPKIWLQDNQNVPVTHAGTPGLLSGQAQPLAMTSVDVDGDGIPDLLIGYSTPGGGVISLQRGNLDAFAPQSDASFQAIAHGQFPSPFLPEAQAFLVPVTPDFLAVGNFTGKGHQDLVVAARGGNALYLLAGDGKGNFGAPAAFDLGGTVTALAVGNLGGTQQYTNLILGLVGPRNTSSVRLMSGTEQGLVMLANYPLAAPASAVDFGDLDGDNLPDAAVLAGGQVSILHASSLQMETLTLPVSASGMALGSFIHDRDPRMQIALLTSEGGVHIAAHQSFDARPFTADEIRLMRQATVTGRPNPLAPTQKSLNESWKIVESFAATAPFSKTSAAPVLLRTRVSSNAADDVMVLNPLAGQMAVISHSNLPDGATTFLPGAVSTRPYAGFPVAAVSARVNIDGRPGVIAAHQGQVAPAVMMPLPDPTFTVNTTADTVSAGACAAATPGQCSLREAIIEANAAPGVDTIIVPAGTYTLTRANATPTTGENAASTGDLDITDGVNIVGAGSATTIVQAGTTNANGIDKVFSINPLFNKAFDTSISGLTIRFGRNQTSFATDGFSGGFDWEASGTGTLQVTDVIVTDNSTADGDGAGITLTNAPGGAGKATIISSVIQNNTVNEASTGGSGLGGGIFAGTHTSFTVTSTQILNNKAVQATGQGGGVYIFGPSGAGGQTQFHAVTISGNQSTLDGGGIHTGAGILIDQGSVISGNSSGAGAGLWSSVTAETTTVTKSTITGNTATGNGGGIRVDNSTPNNFVMNFSRIAGNAAAAGSALSNGTGTVTATNNWWGTNTPAGVITAGAPAVTFDPFIVLTHTASPATVHFGASATLTADFLHDNHGTAIALSNISVLLGLPITFNNAVHGTISNAQTSIQANGTATATFTTNASGTASADAVVDNGTATATMTVPSPPVIIKAFGAASIPLNGSTSLSFTIQNNNTSTTLNFISFSDTLPAGLVISSPSGLTGTCNGSIQAIPGTNAVSLQLQTLSASSSCTFSVNVTGTTAGTKNNTTGNVTSVEGGPGGTASASVNVVAPPSIAKVFNPSSIALNATTSLTFTITNPAANAVALTGVAFADTLPTGLTVANASATVCGGTLTTTAPTGIALSGATIAVNSQCQFSVTVTGAATGSFTNTTGNVTSTNGGTGNTATANLTVASAPNIVKTFGALAIPLNGTTSLSFAITNPNTGIALTGLAFTDSLPAGLVVAPTPGVSNTCGGTVTATAGASSVSLSAGTLAATASCSVSVNVQSTTSGVKNNSVTVSSTESGAGNTSTATITVTSPPVIIKAFGAASIPVNGSTSLSFTIQNNNTTTTLTGMAFSDTLPAGLVVSTPNGLTGTCGGGTITATAGTGTISLSGASLAASSSCTFSVNVTGTTAGTKNNTTGNVTSVEGGTGGTASASLNVEGPPSIAKAFNPTAIATNGTSALTLTITNPAANPIALTGVAVTDNLPAGLVVATPNGLTNTCGGTATATAGSGTISLTGGAVATSSSCAVSVNVTASATGSYVNTTGAASSTNGGTGNTATATLTVQPADLAITKTHSGTFTRGQTGAVWTITVNNIGAGPTVGTVSVVDTLPAIANPPVPTAISGTGWTCTLATLTCTLRDALAPGSSYPAISLTVNIPINIQNTFTNTATVSGGGETNTGNDTATDTVTLGPPIIITPHGPTTLTIAAGNSGTIAFDVTNADPTQGFVGFTCAGLPVGAACNFTPGGVSAGASQMTMTISTSSRKSAALSGWNFNSWRPDPLYTMLVPLLGLAVMSWCAGTRRKLALRRVLALAGMAALLAVAGCGGRENSLATPPGNYQITVTAISMTAQANTSITLTVQ